MSGGPVSYATAAGSKEATTTSSAASSPREPAAATLSSAASPVASPPAPQAKPAAASTNGKQQQQQQQQPAKTKKKPESSSSRKSVTEFTPAPVPSVNVWQKGAPAAAAPAAAATSPAAASASPKSPLDPSNWPKPDEKKEGLGIGSGSKQVRSGGGKEKWVPYSGAGLSPAPPSTNPPPKAPAPNRKKNTTNATTNNNSNNAGRLNGQGGGAFGGKNSTSNNNKAAPKAGNKGKLAQPQQQQSKQKQHNAASSASSSPNPGQGGFKPRYNSNNNNGGRNGFVPGGGFANGGGNRRMSYQKTAAPFYMQTPDFMYNQAAAVAAANGLIQQPFPVPHYDAALGLVIGQVEYYLSVENLCKDIFLRRQMNSKGLVSLNLLASFNRVKSLTNGDKAMLYEACKWAPSCEIIGNKIRPKTNWETWVLPPADRLPGGLDESDESDQPFDENTQQHDASKLSFKPANAVPFVPKTAK